MIRQLLIGGVCLLATPCLAATVAQDTFTEASNTYLESHTPDTGTGWTITTGSTVRVTATTDRAEDSINDTSNVWAKEGTSIGSDIMDVSADVNVGVKIITAGEAGVIGRHPSSAVSFNNLYEAYAVYNSAWVLGKIVGGVFTSLGSYNPSANSGTIKLEIRTAAKKVYINGTERISSADDNLIGNTYAGLAYRLAGGANTWTDNFLSESVPAVARRVMLISRLRDTLLPWISHYILPSAIAQPFEDLAVDTYLSSTCGDGSMKSPRHPCFVDSINPKGWVLLWDGGTTMLVKLLATPETHLLVSPLLKVEPTMFPVAAKAYLQVRGEGMIDRR